MDTDHPLLEALRPFAGAVLRAVPAASDDLLGIAEHGWPELAWFRSGRRCRGDGHELWGALSIEEQGPAGWVVLRLGSAALAFDPKAECQLAELDRPRGHEAWSRYALWPNASVRFAVPAPRVAERDWALLAGWLA